MGDLISRKAVIDLINKRITERKPDGNSIWLRNDEAIDIQSAVEELPTAYDVDKVVAQLESFKCSKEEAEKDMDKFIRNQHFDMCISIVKAGGWNKEKEAIE